MLDKWSGFGATTSNKRIRERNDEARMSNDEGMSKPE